MSAEPDDRRAFLATLGAGAAAVGTLMLAGCGGSGSQRTTTTSSTQATTRSPIPTHATDDGAILAYLLQVEQLLVAFYAQTAQARLFSGAQAALLADLEVQERAHTSALEGELERLGAPRPAASSPRIPRTDARGAARMAFELENLAASAYLGRSSPCSQRL